MPIDPNIETALDEELGYAARDAAVGKQLLPQIEEDRNFQVAGLSKKAGRFLFKNWTTNKVMERVGTRAKDTSKQVDPADVQRTIQDVLDFDALPEQTGKMAEGTSVNIQRASPGSPVADLDRLLESDPDRILDTMQTHEDVGKLIHAIGKKERLKARHVPEQEIREKTASMEDAMRELMPFLEKNPNRGNITKEAAYAARSLLSTLDTDIVKLARQIADGHRTPETLLQYQKKMTAASSLHGWLRGEISEVARTLAQQNMIAKNYDSKNAAMWMNMIEESGGGAENIARHAQIMLNRVEKDGDLLGVDKAVRNTKAKNFFGFWNEYWKASILSGLKTHAVNVTSNAVLQSWESSAVRYMGRGVTMARQAMGGTAPGVAPGEAAMGIAAGVHSLTDATHMALQTIKQGESVFSTSAKTEQGGYMPDVIKALGKRIAGERGIQAGDKLASALGVSFRLLEAEDEFFKVMGFRGELARLAYRQAYHDGKVGDDLVNATRRYMDDPPDDMFSSAVEYAKRMTFTDQQYGGLVGYMVDSAKKLADNVYPIKFVMPFINTPGSIANYIVESTPLAFANYFTTRSRWVDIMRKGGPEKDMAIARMLAGTGLMALGTTAYATGFYNGNGPANPALRQTMMKTGWKPNSIRVPAGLIPGSEEDVYFSINRLDPMGKMFGMIGDLMDSLKYAGEENFATDVIMNLGMGLGNQLKDSTYLKGVSDFFDAFNYGGEKMTRLLANYGSAFVPWSAALKNIRDLPGMDDHYRAVDSLYREPLGTKVFWRTMDQIQNRFPVLSRNLRPKRYWDGSMMTPGAGKWVAFINPVDFSVGNGSDKATNEIIANQVAITEPKDTITLSGQTFSLLTFDNGSGLFYDRYIEEIGKERRKAVEATIKSDIYQKAEGGINSPRSELISRAVNKATGIARNRFLDDFHNMLSKDRDRANQTLVRVFDDKRANLRQFADLIKKGKIQNEWILQRVKRRGSGEGGGKEFLPQHLQQ